MISLFLRVFELVLFFPSSLQKPGLMRVDAARDAMRPLGFSERVIDDTIKDLLQVC